MLSHDEALKQLIELKDSLYKSRDLALPKRVFNSQNFKILEDYWDSEYAHRDIIAPEDRKSALKRAVAGVGSLSLAVATRSELQIAVNRHFTDNNKQRPAVASLNQILKWLGRGFTLNKQREVKRDVSYLTLEEFEKVIAHISPQKPEDAMFIALCKAAFATGCRLGELFTLTRSKYHGSFIWVKTQLDENDKERATKTRKERKAFVIKERREWIEEWLDIEDKAKIRHMNHAAKLRRACRKAFPSQNAKHCKFHDIRHSYAIYLLQVKHASLTLVALSLGNGQLVCEKYYGGFILTDYGIDYLDRL